jgi:predicted GIY-YIG superfamily endonuclease
MVKKKKSKAGWVYGVEHKTPGSNTTKTYVGKTSNLKRRLKQHGVKK